MQTFISFYTPFITTTTLYRSVATLIQPFHLQTSMSVRMTLIVVMRMQSVLTLMATTLAPVLLGILEMDRVVWVCYGDIKFSAK